MPAPKLSPRSRSASNAARWQNFHAMKDPVAYKERQSKRGQAAIGAAGDSPEARMARSLRARQLAAKRWHGTKIPTLDAFKARAFGESPR